MEKPTSDSKEKIHKVVEGKSNSMLKSPAPTQFDVITDPTILPVNGSDTFTTLPSDAKWETLSTTNIVGTSGSSGSKTNASTDTAKDTALSSPSCTSNLKSSFLLEFAIMGTIAAQFVGEGNITHLPENVLQYGGLWFLFAHFLLIFFMGLPIVFFELLIGQITGKGALAAYGTYCTAAKGIGVSLFIISMFLESFGINLSVDNPGIHIQILLSSLGGNNNFMKCNNLWNTNDCISLYESISECPAIANNKQFAYINNNCTTITYDRALKDALQEYSDYHSSSAITDMNIYQLATSLSIVILPMSLVFVDIKYTFYTFAAIFCIYFILFLVYMGVLTLVNDGFGSAFDYIWHRTEFNNLVNPMGLNALVNGVLYGLNIHGVMAPIGSYLLPKDRSFRIVFFPLLLSLFVSIISLVLAVLGLQSLSKYAPASGYLYSTTNDGTHGLLMFSQLLSSKTGSMGWLSMVAVFKLLGSIGQMSFEVIGMKEFFRDHLDKWRNDGIAKLITVGCFIFIHATLLVLFCHPTTNSLIKEIYLVSAGNFCKRFLYFAAILICIKLYGEVDFRIDIGEIYEEHENWRRFFSPIGPIMFYCWLHFVPLVLLLSQAFVFLDALQLFRSHSLSAIIPVSMALLAPTWAFVTIIRQKMKGNTVSSALLPSEDHPSYKRIVGKSSTSS